MGAGRRLAPMLMTHDSKSNRKVLKVNRELDRIGPILLLLLLPQIIAAIQAALAGRSLEVDKAELAAKFNRRLFGGLTGNTGGGLGSGDLLGGLTGGNTGGNPLDLLGGLTGGNTGGTNPLDLLGGLTGGGASPADLAAIISSGGDPAELLSNPLVQNMIQQVVQQQMEEFMNNGGPEEMINQVMAMGDEEMMAMIMPFIPEDMQGTVQELAAMSYEEFFQHMMDQMGMNGGLEGMLAGMGDMGDVGVNMTDIIAQWEAPFDVYCDCLPTDMEMATFT